MQALSVKAAAHELGKSPGWLYKNWQRLVASQVIPKPLLDDTHLVWSAAHWYAFQDRKLTPSQGLAACAYRAAYAAALAVTSGDLDSQDEIAAARQQLSQRFASRPSVG